MKPKLQIGKIYTRKNSNHRGLDRKVVAIENEIRHGTIKD